MEAASGGDAGPASPLAASIDPIVPARLARSGIAVKSSLRKRLGAIRLGEEAADVPLSAGRNNP